MYILQILGWIFSSIAKFLFTPSAMISLGYGFFETVIITSFGSALGVTGFYYGGEAFFRWWESKQRKKSAKKHRSKSRRRLIWIKQRFGLKGLAIIAGLISVPIAALLAAKYFREKSYTLPVMIFSFVSWSVFLTALSYLVKHFIS